MLCSLKNIQLQGHLEVRDRVYYETKNVPIRTNIAIVHRTYGI